MTHLHTIKNAENRKYFRGNFAFLSSIRKITDWTETDWAKNSLDENKAPGVKIYNLFIKQIGLSGTKLTNLSVQETSNQRII